MGFIAKAIAARRDGDDKQALRFCLEATKLFRQDKHVVEVGFELEDCRGFDDLMVRYNPPIPDGRGGLTETDHIQVKHRVLQAGLVRAGDLIDPEFIHATRESLLQKAHRLQTNYQPSGTSFRLILEQPFPIADDDILSKLVDREGKFRLEVLADGGGNSAMGKLRKQWREHLGVDDAGLYQALSPLRLRCDGKSLKELCEVLNDQLLVSGFKPVEASRQDHPYVGIIWKQYGDLPGELRLDRAGFENLMRQHGLYQGQPFSPQSAHRLGIRSFLDHTKYFDEELDFAPCCLVEHFEGRGIKQPELWKTQIYGKVKDFLSDQLRPRRKVHLALETHFPIAVLTGHLAARSGAEVIPLQQGQAWEINRPPQRPHDDLWDLRAHQQNAGPDIVVAISVAQPTGAAVVAATESLGLQNAHIVEAIVLPETGRTAVLNADHAFLLAKELNETLQKLAVARPEVRFHLFGAVPTALAYMIGEATYALGQIELYDYNPLDRRYHHTFSLP